LELTVDVKFDDFSDSHPAMKEYFILNSSMKYYFINKWPRGLS